MATPPHPPETRQLIEHLCNLQVPNDIQVSPTANHILYATSLSYDHKKGKHVVSTLWLADTGKQDSSRQLTSGNTRDYHPRWHPQEDCIAFISDRARPGEQWAIYLWQFSQGLPFGEPHPITDTENERPIVAFEFSPDGRRLAFLCADPKTAEDKAREAHGEDWKVWGQEWVNVRLRTVDLETKAVVRHAGKDHSSKSFDDHVTALCWRDSQSLAVVHTRTSHIEEPFLSGSKVSLVKIGPVDTPEMAQMWSIEVSRAMSPNVEADYADPPGTEAARATCILRCTASLQHQFLAYCLGFYSLTPGISCYSQCHSEHRLGGRNAVLHWWCSD